MCRDDLDPREREALDGLPREKSPPPELEERVVARMRAEGLIRESVPRWTFTRRSLGLAAAACALVLLGFACGQWHGLREAGRAYQLAIQDAQSLSQPAARTDEATRLTGSPELRSSAEAYLGSLATLAENSADGDEIPRQQREAAAATLYEAAQLLLSISPDDPLAGGLVRTLDGGRSTPTPEEDEGSKRIMWF